MDFGIFLSIGTIVTVVSLLAFTRLAPDLILLFGLTILMLFGVVDTGQALSGLTNQGMITVGVLYIVAAGLRHSGGMELFTPQMLGQPKSLLQAQVRIMFPVGILSAFLNNTPVVAMFIPAISDWAKKHQIAISKLLIPLSYAAIFGGVCTLIGTSTNLVVNGLLINYSSQSHLEYTTGLGLFEIAKIGLPIAFIGILYVLLFGSKLLPIKQTLMSQFSNPREYTIEMIVEPNSPLIDRTIEQVGLRHLQGMYLMEIERQGELIPAVSPNEKLQPNDRLVFVGIVDSVLDLQKMRGLKPATNQIFKVNGPRSRRILIEAVVSNSFPHLGKSIRTSQFRTRYNAVIIGVARNGERIRKKIGDIILKQGDTLLLEALPSFIKQQRNSRDFFLISQIDDSSPPNFEKAGISVLILGSMVTAVTLQWLSMLHAAILAAGLMIATRCVSWSTAKKSIDWQVLLVIVAAFGMGRALDTTGAAALIAGGLIRLAGDSPWMALIVVYGVTSLFTELITNNAAAVLVFPIAMASAAKLGVNPLPFVISIMIGASASFSTPIGYQTNLMVYGPGGYKFTDYLKIGIPLNLIIWFTAVCLIPLIWPF